MSEINGGRIFAKALKKEGVECVFTLAGGHIMPILYGCRAEGIEVIDVRHECSGGYGADAYARVSGKPGVLITTAGPGVTNATTAMAEALDAGIPLIHIGGASPQKESITGPLQELKTLEAMAVFSKWAERIVSSDRIPEYVAHAFRHAMDATPGPVYLEIAFEVLYEVYEEDELYWPEAYRTDAQPFGDPALIEKAAELLINAQSPVMIVGDNARFSKGCEEYVKKLSEYLSMPVYAMNVARGVFASETEDPLWGLGGYAAPGADVILELCVNNNYLIYKGQEPFFPEKAIKIQVHPDKT
ncbi:MAG: thiamine pyrophosphate-binding protein, partial [Bacillota bacterium]|nr:thiamine pyrophosphate-binding protein [Bacillota bacterium]